MELIELFIQHYENDLEIRYKTLIDTIYYGDDVVDIESNSYYIRDIEDDYTVLEKPINEAYEKLCKDLEDNNTWKKGLLDIDFVIKNKIERADIDLHIEYKEFNNLDTMIKIKEITIQRRKLD